MKIPFRSLTALALGVSVTVLARAQETWTWPEHPKNLQVLSKEMTGQKLRPVMTGFTRALGVARYKELRAKFEDRGAYDFGEGSLNAFAYDLLGKNDTEGALAIFRLNASTFPESPNVWDSLAEAYATAGRKEKAEIYYRKSLELDPENKNALEKIRALAGVPASPK